MRGSSPALDFVSAFTFVFSVAVSIVVWYFLQLSILIARFTHSFCKARRESIFLLSIGNLPGKMSAPEKFRGFQVLDPAKWTEFHLNELTPKPFGDFDVDIKIEACGVCASDLHTISGGWGEQHFPLCVGHGWCNFLVFT